MMPSSRAKLPSSIVKGPTHLPLFPPRIDRTCHSEPKAKNPRISFAAAVLISIAIPALAQPANLLARVDAHYNHLRTLRAHYTERYTGMGLDRTESGTLELRKPGLMCWAYDAPVGKLFVLDGHFAWFYTPGDAQVTRAPAKQLDDLRTPLRLLLGHTQLAKELDHPVITSAPNNTFLITGVPRAMADRVHSLSLTVTADGAITAMRIEETTGAVTAFTFTDQKEDLPLPPSDFTFTPPADLPIVNAQPPI
jgi:outer membrane lipoprotein carrier protein